MVRCKEGHYRVLGVGESFAAKKTAWFGSEIAIKCEKNENRPKNFTQFTFAGAHLVRAPRVRSAVRRGGERRGPRSGPRLYVREGRGRGTRPAQRAEVVQEGGREKGTYGNFRARLSTLYAPVARSAAGIVTFRTDR